MNTIIINYKAPPRRRGAGPQARATAAGHVSAGRLSQALRACPNARVPAPTNETTASPPEAHN